MNDLVETFTKYIEARVGLLKVEAQEQVTAVIFRVIQLVLLAFLSLFTLIFASAGLGAWLGKLFGAAHLGYFAVAGFYLLLFGFTLIRKDHNPIKGLIEKATGNIFAKEKGLEIAPPTEVSQGKPVTNE